MADSEHNEERDLQGPPRLRRALGDLQKESIFIPPAVDEAVLNRVRPQLARVRRRRDQQRAVNWIVLAASIVFVACVAQVAFRLPNADKKFSREDVNRDGRVDILDAFQLAREIKQGKSEPKGFDLNGDGRVDEGDVEVIARRAVSLEKGS